MPQAELSRAWPSAAADSAPGAGSRRADLEGRGSAPQGDLAARLCQEGAKASCCTKDEGRSFGAALWEEASNCRKLLRSKAAVVNVPVKRRGF